VFIIIRNSVTTSLTISPIFDTVDRAVSFAMVQYTLTLWLEIPILYLRAIRALRFIRLIRLLKLARYGKALERYRAAFKDIKVDLLIFTFITVILLYIAAVGIYHFEHAAQPEVFKSIFDALWWAVATLTTVGYGDIYPITLGGKLFTFIILVLGLGVVAVPTGLIAAALTEARKPSNNNQQSQNTGD
jgi:voltage-gated potassium channel